MTAHGRSGPGFCRRPTRVRLKMLSLLGCGLFAATLAHGQASSTEDFTGSSTTNNWYYFNGACLTAGTGASNGSNGTVAGPVPGCANILSTYYANASDHDPLLYGGNTDTQNSTGRTTSWADPVGLGA